MSDFLEWILKQIVSTVTNAASNSGLTDSLKSYSSDIYSFVTSIQQTVMKPVAVTVLALFFMLELQRIVIRSESFGGGSEALTKSVGISAIKYAIIMWVFTSMGSLLDGFIAITNKMTTGIQSLLTSSSTSGLLNADTMYKPIADSGFFTKLFIAAALLIGWLIVIIAKAIVKIMVIMRFLELYVLYAVAPIPLATMPSQEFSSIAKNFFKAFIATAIQGTLMFMVQAFYPFLLSTAFKNIDNSLGGTLTAIFGMGILLILAIMQTSRWAKTITTAM